MAPRPRDPTTSVPATREAATRLLSANPSTLCGTACTSGATAASQLHRRGQHERPRRPAAPGCRAARPPQDDLGLQGVDDVQGLAGGRRPCRRPSAAPAGSSVTRRRRPPRCRGRSRAVHVARSLRSAAQSGPATAPAPVRDRQRARMGPAFRGHRGVSGDLVPRRGSRLTRLHAGVSGGLWSARVAAQVRRASAARGPSALTASRARRHRGAWTAARWHRPPAPWWSFAERVWALVREAVVGRLAVIVGESPEIFPVNHVVDRGTVVFRTARGTKLSAALENPAVAFEVDGYDAVNGDAWSVVVKGRAEEVKEMYDVLEVIELPIFPVARGPQAAVHADRRRQHHRPPFPRRGWRQGVRLGHDGHHDRGLDRSRAEPDPLGARPQATRVSWWLTGWVMNSCPNGSVHVAARRRPSPPTTSSGASSGDDAGTTSTGWWGRSAPTARE